VLVGYGVLVTYTNGVFVGVEVDGTLVRVGVFVAFGVKVG
jgi:hypothetical protein